MKQAVAAVPAMTPAAPAEKQKLPPIVQPVSFAQQVQPILTERCVGCHNEFEENGGLALDSLDRLMKGGGSGAVIAPGNPDASRLWRLVSHHATPHMPPKQPRLPDDALAAIQQWIAAGAPGDNGDAASAPETKMSEPGPAAVKPVAVAAVRTGPPLPIDAPTTRTPQTPRPIAATAMAASPVAPLVAVRGSRQVVLYHAESHELLAILPFPEGRAATLQFSPDGEWLLAAGGAAERRGRVVVFDVRSGDRLIELDGGHDAIPAATMDAFRELIAYGGSDRIVRVYDAFVGEPAYDIKQHNDWITAVAFSPDATLLTTADRSGGLFVWEAETGRPVHELRGHAGAVHDVAFSPDSATLFSAGDDGTIRLWRMTDGAALKHIGAHGGAVLCLAVAADGRLLSGGADRLAKLWKADGAAQATLEALDDWVYQVVFAQNDALLYAGTWTGMIHVFDADSAKRLRQFDTNPAAAPRDVPVSAAPLPAS